MNHEYSCARKIHKHIYLYYIYMCVCVNYLERCKTSYLAGGRWGTLQSAANEDAAMFLWKRTCNFPVFRQWQPAKPRTGMSFFQQFSNYCTVFAIWLSCIRTSKSFEQGRRKISLAQFLTSNHQTIPVRFNWSVFARAMRSTSVIR